MAGETGNIRSISAALRSAPVALKHAPGDAPSKPPSFVTISRQGGAGGRTVGQLLVDRLNQLDPGETPWMLWDRELVEKVAQDHNLARELVDSLEESGRTWLEDFLAGLATDGDETEATIYQKVATAIRVLAQKGRAVLVGRGGVYITHNVPRGVHLRLVAPFEDRARHMAEQLGISNEAAMAQVKHLDKQRAAFYRRYWPTQALHVETFTLTINTALVGEERAVESALPLILPATRSMIERKPAKVTTE